MDPRYIVCCGRRHGGLGLSPGPAMGSVPRLTHSCDRVLFAVKLVLSGDIHDVDWLVFLLDRLS